MLGLVSLLALIAFAILIISSLEIVKFLISLSLLILDSSLTVVFVGLLQSITEGFIKFVKFLLFVYLRGYHRKHYYLVFILSGQNNIMMRPSKSLILKVEGKV